MQRKTWCGCGDEDGDQGGQGAVAGSRCSFPQGLLEHVLVCHPVWQSHHQALVLPHRLADDLICLLVPGPTAAGHLSRGAEGSAIAGASVIRFSARHSGYTGAALKPPGGHSVLSVGSVCPCPARGSTSSSSLGHIITYLPLDLKPASLLLGLPIPCRGTGQAPRSHPQLPSSPSS